MQTMAEEEAVPESDPEEHWQAVAPLLHQALTSLGEQDRVAVLLRYFENRSLKEVGTVLGTSEDAARLRVARAIEKLRGYLRQQGVAVPALALATLLAERTVQAAPASCAPAITRAVFDGAGASTHVASTGSAGKVVGLAGKTAALSLKGVLIAMLAKKMIVVLAAVLVLGLLGGVVVVRKMHPPGTVYFRDAETGELLATIKPGEKGRGPVMGRGTNGIIASNR